MKNPSPQIHILVTIALVSDLSLLNFLILEWKFYRLGTISSKIRLIQGLAYFYFQVTKCTFNNYGPSGTVENKDGLCVLAINIINEKIYIFLWFWFLTLCVWTGVHLFIRILSMALINFRYSCNIQCWTEGRSSTAVAEDFRPTATMAEVCGQTYGQRSYL